MLEVKGIDKVDLIGHCEGAVNATLLALEHPEKVRSLVLLAPGGMVGEDSFVRVVEPFVKKIVRNNFKALGAIASGKPLRPQVSPGMATRRTPPTDTYLKHRAPSDYSAKFMLLLMIVLMECWCSEPAGRASGYTREP